MIGGSAALLVLAVMVSTAAAQLPPEILVYKFDPNTDNLNIEGGILDHSGNGYNGTSLSFLGLPPRETVFVPGHTAGTTAPTAT